MPYKDPVRAREYNTERQKIYRARHPERTAERSKRWRARNPEKAKLSNGYCRRRYLKAEYGITEDEYNAFVAKAEGKCVCGNDLVRPHLDHCHETGVVRGLLCQPCNMALGLLRDDPARLRRLASYVEKFS